jgi:hypothetical protein
MAGAMLAIPAGEGFKFSVRNEDVRLASPQASAPGGVDEICADTLKRCNYYFGGFYGGERCQRRRGHAENESEGHEWPLDREPAQAEAGRPTAPATKGDRPGGNEPFPNEVEKEFIAAPAAPLQGEQGSAGFREWWLSEGIKHMPEYNEPPEHASIAEQAWRAGIEKGLEIAAQWKAALERICSDQKLTRFDMVVVAKRALASAARKETP